MKKIDKNVRETLKKIPSLDDILKSHQIPHIPRSFLKFHINSILTRIRKEVIENNINNLMPINDYIDIEIKSIIKKISSNSLKPVINGTGIILHTGLGRAPISKEILIDGINQTYPYSNLELNIETSKRGNRNQHISTLLNSLCNSNASIIVNNNAAAVMLVLNSLCQDKEVIVSRGQQVEIGGSFRIPEIIKKSQCKMVEVGTTNKTHLSDYNKAINSNTAAILYVHTSNFKVIGFTNEIDIKQLSEIAHKKNIPLLIDLGSGSLADYKSFGLPLEKLVSEYSNYGADIITFSGDKLLGGPQAGIIVGDKELINIIHKNPIYRAVRCDKIRISIMENVLRTYYTTKEISNKNLSISLFKRVKKQLEKNAKKIISGIDKNIKKEYNIDYNETQVEAGSGSLPTEKIISVAILFSHINITPNELSKKFLSLKIPVVGYIKNNIFYIDLKAILDNQINLLIKNINEALK